VAHAAPRARFVEHVFAAMQYAKEAQSPSTEHDVVQAPAVHRNGAQSTGVARTQLPEPSQSSTDTVSPMQLGPPHATVGRANRRHAPAPSQSPSPLQELGNVASRGQASRGSVSAATSPHAPSAPLPLRAAVQATHAPTHAASQQTPSAQCPVAHSSGSEHAAPLFLTQRPDASQLDPAAHVSASIALLTTVQVPGVAAHVWQIDAHALSQQ
jgi:hypothetical protein